MKTYILSIGDIRDKKSGVVETVSVIASDGGKGTDKRLLAVTRWNDTLKELRAYYQVLDHSRLVYSATDLYAALAAYNEIK